MAQQYPEALTLWKGETHILAVPGLGSAGYQWKVQSADAKIVLIEEVLHTAGEARGIKRESLRQRFRLTALAPGSTCICFVQVRSLAPDRPHVIYEIGLTVTGNGSRD